MGDGQSFNSTSGTPTGTRTTISGTVSHSRLNSANTLKSIDVLVPKVKCFNDFVELNADEFSDMRMWH